MTTRCSPMIGTFVMVLLLSPSRSDAEPIFPPGSTVAGKTIGQWTGEWWNWVNSMPAAVNPIDDPTGAGANINQDAPIFFVAGTGGGVVTRTFTVPIDTPLLIPLLNVTYYRTPEPVDAAGIPIWFSSNPQASVAPPDPGFVEQFTRDNLLVQNPATSLFLEIDGVAVPQSTLLNHVEGSRYTAVIAPGSRANLRGEPAGTWSDSYSIGYYVMVEPLGVGTHTLRFGGTRQAGASVEVLATVTVVPEPSSLALLGIGGSGLLLLHGLRRRAAGGLPTTP